MGGEDARSKPKPQSKTCRSVFDGLRAEAKNEGFARSIGYGPTGMRVRYGLSGTAKLYSPFV
jgi:hypothetical protein